MRCDAATGGVALVCREKYNNSAVKAFSGSDFSCSFLRLRVLICLKAVGGIMRLLLMSFYVWTFYVTFDSFKIEFAMPYLWFVCSLCEGLKIMPAQKKITSAYNVRKGTPSSTSKVTSPNKRSMQGECILS